MVINTMGWVDGLGYELLLHAVAALRADVVLVVGQDRLYSQLSSELRCVLRWRQLASVRPAAERLAVLIAEWAERRSALPSELLCASLNTHC